LQINKPAAFTVDFNGAQGKLDARVVAPSGAEDQAIIQEVDKGKVQLLISITNYLKN
jgi:filamin